MVPVWELQSSAWEGVQDLEGEILMGILSRVGRKVQSKRRDSEGSEMLIGSRGLCEERQRFKRI